MQQTYGYRDFLGKSVDVQNTRVSTTDDTLGLQNTEIGLERGDSLDRLGRRGQDETRHNVFIVDTTQSDTDVVTAECRFQFVVVFSV
jgi:hypothetical protein